jgi:hypothetical protein
VVQVDLELSRRKFRQRGAGRNVLGDADRVEIGQEIVDLVQVLHDSVLRARLGGRSRMRGNRGWKRSPSCSTR